MLLPSGERVAHFHGPAGRAGAFKCSFVKASKMRVKRPSDLIQRLQERYGEAAAPSSSSAATALPPAALDVVTAGEVGTTLGSHKPIELVGVEKLRSRQTLATVEKIALAGCQLAALGFERAGELRARTPLISELDLSFNLFASWAQIFRVARELPALETLILSGNRLQLDDSDCDCDEFVFPRVKTLVLNQTLVTCADVRRLLDRHFPQVVELHLVENELTDADLDALVHHERRPWMETLEVLDVSQNHLRSWSKLLDTVGRQLPSLKQLVANANQISTLAAPADGAFQQLRALSVCDNAIASWTSIDALNRYPQLDTLRFTRNPLIAQMGAGEVRMIIIARAEFVAAINGSVVRAKERQDAEQMYLKRILHEIAAVGDGSEDLGRVLASHPRFARLQELYPDIYIGSGGSASAAAGPAALAASLIQVKIVPMSMQATSFEPLVKKVPEKMKIAQLKVLVEKKFGVEAPSQVLSFRPDARVRRRVLRWRVASA